MNDSGDNPPPPAVSGNKKGGLRSRWPNILSWLISAAALAYVLSRVQLSQLSKDLSGTTWWLIAAAIVVETIPRLLETVRWRSLLQPICTRFFDLLKAIYIGTVYSSILPLSGGDLVRGVIVARTAAANLTQVLSTELVERVVDAVAIILVVWFALRGLALPPTLRVVRIVLEIGVGAAIAGGLVMVIRRVDLMTRLEEWKTSNSVLRRIRTVGIDLVHAIGWVRPRAMMVAMAAALGAVVVERGGVLADAPGLSHRLVPDPGRRPVRHRHDRHASSRHAG